MAWLLCAALSAPAPAPAGRSFTVYSEPIELRYGEVHNRIQQPAALPADVVSLFADGANTMAVTDFEMDIVRVGSDGQEHSVPLYDHYLHHYILNFGTSAGIHALHAAAQNRSNGLGSRMVDGKKGLRRWREQTGAIASFGSAAGAEYRHNSHAFLSPFRVMLTQPAAWMPTLHVINTLPPNATAYRGVPSPLLQCPCTPQRVFNIEAGTIDGKTPDPPMGYCDDDFIAAANPSCSLATYQGGWRCCEDGVFLIDTSSCERPHCAELPRSRVQLKAVFQFEVVPTNKAQHGSLQPTACCDVTSDWQGDGNIEYDVPRCAAGTPAAECVHITQTVQPLDYYGYDGGPSGESLVQLGYAAAHLHLAGISLELQDATTNATVCKVSRAGGGGVRYGTSSAAGDEANYLVGLSPCVWGGKDAPTFQRQHPMRTIAVYNASATQTGVMALWLMNAAEVREPARCGKALDAAGCHAEAGRKSCLRCAESHASALYAAGCQDDMVEAACVQAA